MLQQAIQNLPDLQRGESQFRRCLENLPVGAYTCDARGLITYYNSAAVRAWGREPKLNDPLDRFCGSFKLYASDGVPLKHEDCWMGLALKHNKKYVGEEIVVERPDGSRITVLAHATPICDDDGELLGAVNVLVDIDERKQAVDAIHKAHEAAQALNRAKDRFLAVLSHELRTPLSPVVMMIAAMERDPDLPQKFRDDVVMMRRNLELETKLIDDLLDVSRVISGKLHLEMRLISAHDKLRHVINNCVSDLFSKRLTIRTEFNATNDRFMGDPARFQQVFWNLLRNATKFTPDGGQIVVRTSDDDLNQLVIEIRDNGVGIPAAVLPDIFNPFEQGDAKAAREFGGMGLGLTISRSIVEMHGGSISAASEGPSKGATFTVRVPANNSRHEKGDLLAPAKADGPASRRASLLLVEDHADTASVLSRLLGLSGYKVKVATSAAMAMQLASTEQFDVVISDIGLPDASGYELMVKLRERGDVKGIAMSGYGMEEDIERSRQAGFIEHLVKPVQMSQLEAVLESVLNGKRAVECA